MASTLTLSARHHAAIGFTIAAVCLTIGVFAGRATVEQAAPQETYVMPPFSTQSLDRQSRASWCLGNKAFDDFRKSKDDHYRREVYPRNVVAIPLSDRGLVCTIEGVAVETEHSRRKWQESEFKETLIVALNGDAEFVSEDFAKSLNASPVVRAMASNFGDDGTVMPVVRVSF